MENIIVTENIWEFLAEHYLITALAACAFLIFIGIGKVEAQHSTKNFFWATFFVLILIFAEAGEYIYSMLAEAHTMRVACSVAAYIARSTIAFCIALVPTQRITPHFARLLSIPLIIDAAVVCSAFFCPLAFYFDEMNHYQRGPLGYVPFVVGGFYILVFLYFCFQRLRRSEMQEVVIGVCGMSVCVLATVIEYMLNSKGALSLVMLLSELYYFMYLLMTKYSTDFLTGAYVRSHVYSEVEARNSDRWYITFDVNGLKRINDRDGHEAGDAALVAFSKIVYDCLPSTALFYRTGGDEFAVIYRTDREELAVRFTEHVVEYGRHVPELCYGVSAGYAHFTCKSDFHAATSKADAMLYENKRAFWAAYDKKY